MPTLLTTPSLEPYDFLRSAERTHRANNLDFPALFDWFYREHYVLKGPEFFIMFYAERDRDAWYVWWAEAMPRRTHAEMLALFLRHMPHYRAEVGWWRPLKNGKQVPTYYSTARLLRFIGRQA